MQTTSTEQPLTGTDDSNERSSGKWERLKRNMKQAKHYYVLMAPYLIIFSLFTVVPVLASLALRFTSFNILEMPQFVGYDNYARLFLADDVFVTVSINTLVFAVITVPLSYVVASLFAC